MPTIQGVVCEELQNSPRESLEGLTFRATQEFVCAWADRLTLTTSLLTANDGLGYAYIHAPTGYTNCYARKVGVQPYKGDVQLESASGTPPNEWATWELAHIIVEYSTPTLSADGPQISGGEGVTWGISETLEGWVEAIVLDYKKFQWGMAPGNPITPEEAPVKQVHGFDYSVTHWRVPIEDIGDPYTALATILPLVGKANSNEVTPLVIPGMVWTAGQVRCKPPVVQVGDTTCNIIYRFAVRLNDGGWNKYWNPAKSGAPGWDSIYLQEGPTEYKNYPEAEFPTG